MDERAFDHLTRLFAVAQSRRAALGSLVAASVLGIAADAGAKRKGRGKKRGHHSNCKKSKPHRCGKSCTNRLTDAKNCGTCGNACPEGDVCIDGSCACGTGAVRCGSKCGEGNCCAGTDAVTCANGKACCSPRGCKDLQLDLDACGTCENSCFEGEECLDGTCVCGKGKVLCGGVCAVGNCCQGTVAVTCDAGTTCCTPKGCTNTQNDPNNCGGCGITCSGATNTCVNGSCSCGREGGPCTDGKVCKVGDVCECPPKPAVPLGCGECQLDCPEDQPCTDGHCGCKANEIYYEGDCHACPPPPPGIGLPGSGQGTVCNADNVEYCSCGGGCCDEPGDCFVVYNGVHEVVDEFCCKKSGRFVCGDQCCENADCDKGCFRQTARGGSYRRPGR